jgi:uncharacterized phage-associated protein
MATVYDFDAYMRRRLASKFGTLGQVARHKLLYAIHRAAIAKNDAPAFDCRCEAWPMGPVFTALYFNDRGIGNPDALTQEEQAICDWVARVLGATSGRKLAARSHAKYPEWYIARKNRKDKTITVEAIREQLALVRP